MRTIVEEKIVSVELEKVRGGFRRIDDVYAGIQWRLSREPQNGFLFLKSPNYYLFKFAPVLNGYPNITVLYTFDDNTVTITNILFS